LNIVDRIAVDVDAVMAYHQYNVCIVKQQQYATNKYNIKIVSE